MAIYKKSVIEKRVEELERYYLDLKTALEGRAPNSHWASAYRVTEEELPERYVNVNLDEVLLRLEHFKAEFTAIKALKTQAVKPSRT